MIEVKLFRADLEHGLDKQLFEISSEYFVDEAVEIAEAKITCSLTSEKQWHGYRLTGEISIPFFETCDLVWLSLPISIRPNSLSC